MNDAVSRSELLNRLETLRMHYTLKAGYYDAMTDAIGELRSAPALDAVPVVRCKDCINSQLIYDADRVWCNVWLEEVERNGFCHHGNATNNSVSNVPEKNVGEFGGVINAVD